MVIHLATMLLAVEPTKSVLERLDPYRRTAVIMALVGLVILAAFLMIAIMLGGRMVRRMGRGSRRRAKIDPKLRARVKAALQAKHRASTGDTMIGLDETRIMERYDDDDLPDAKP